MCHFEFSQYKMCEGPKILISNWSRKEPEVLTSLVAVSTISRDPVLLQSTHMFTPCFRKTQSFNISCPRSKHLLNLKDSVNFTSPPPTS